MKVYVIYLLSNMRFSITLLTYMRNDFVELNVHESV